MHTGAADQHCPAAASTGDEHASSWRQHRGRTDSRGRGDCTAVHRFHSPDVAHRSCVYRHSYTSIFIDCKRNGRIEVTNMYKRKRFIASH